MHAQSQKAAQGISLEMLHQVWTNLPFPLCEV